MSIKLRFIQNTLLTLLGLLISFSAAYAQSDVILSIDDHTVIPGEDVLVTVNMTPNGNNLGAVTISILYDADVVSITSDDCTLNADYSGVCNIPTPGEVRLALIAFSGINTDVTLADMNFSTIGSGGQSSALTMSVETLSNTIGERVNYTADDGQITLDAPVRATISGEVFDDLDEDGVRDGVDQGVADITVNLLDGDGNRVDSVQTNAIGTYMFADVEPGTYTVQVVAPTGKEFSPPNQGNNEATDSEVDATGVTASITVENDDVVHDVDAGLVDEGNPSFTFEKTIEGQEADTVAEAVQATVNDDLTFEYTVENTGDVAIEWTTLNDDVFGNLTSACQLPTIIPVGGNASCNTVRPADDAPTGKRNIGSVTIRNVGTADDPAWYITDSDNATITGRVFNDATQNGIQDPTDAGISGIQIRLVDALGNFIDSTTSRVDDPNTAQDETGTYQFVGVTPDALYRVEFVVPTPESYITFKDEGDDDTIDSDANQISGRTDIITVALGETSANNDAGLFDFLQSKPATLGDNVWEDLDGDGVQDAGEPSVSGVTVQLLTPSDTVLETTTTDGDGMYLFTNLVPDTYKVRFVLPNGYDAFTDQDTGIDETADSDADPTTGESDVIILGLSEVNLDVDAGIVRFVSIGDFVWEDLDADGIQDAGEPGVEDVAVELYEVGNNTPIASIDTDSNGLYEFTSLHPGEYYVVFEKPDGNEFTDRDAGSDNTVDSDANPNSGPDVGATDSVVVPSGTANDTLDAGLIRPGSIGDTVWLDEDNDGVQDANEAGVPDVTVNLLDENGNEIASTTTDENGIYEFPVLPGTYIVEFEQPNGFSLSPQDQGNDDTVDSDPEPITGRTDPIQVESGENIDDVDAGLGGLGSIGNFVWSDTNDNGIQDPGEPGIDGVNITLLTEDIALDQTTTSNGGFYIFENLDAGIYNVAFSTPDGFMISPQDQGNDDNVDSDINQTSVLDPNDPLLSIFAGLVNDIVLEPGQHRDDVDAGYVPEQHAISVEKSTNGEDADSAPGPAIGVGDTVTWVYVVTNIGNVNLENITVTDDQEGDITTSCPADKVAFLAIGDSFTCTVIDTAIEGQYRNEVTVEGAVEDTGENQPSDSVSDTDVSHYVGVGVDLGITKIDHVDPLDAGEALFYTIVYSNAGPSTATNVVIEETLPLGVLVNELVSQDPDIGLPTGVWSAGEPFVLRWTIPSLAAGESGEIVLHVDTDPSLEGTTIENVVTISSDTVDSNPDNNEDIEPTDFRVGGVGIPTAVELLSFTTKELPNGSTLVRWVTGAEINTQGFDLYRMTGVSSSFDAGSAAHVTEGVEIVGESVFGGEYTFIDNSTVPEVTYTYWLVETEINGTVNTYGPAGGSVGIGSTLNQPDNFSIFLPVVQR